VALVEPGKTLDDGAHGPFDSPTRAMLFEITSPVNAHGEPAE
jgi:hypothetical protein